MCSVTAGQANGCIKHQLWSIILLKACHVSYTMSALWLHFGPLVEWAVNKIKWLWIAHQSSLTKNLGLKRHNLCPRTSNRSHFVLKMLFMLGLWRSDDWSWAGPGNGWGATLCSVCMWFQVISWKTDVGMRIQSLAKNNKCCASRWTQGPCNCVMSQVLSPSSHTAPLHNLCSCCWGGLVRNYAERSPK